MNINDNSSTIPKHTALSQSGTVPWVASTVNDDDDDDGGGDLFNDWLSFLSGSVEDGRENDATVFCVRTFSVYYFQNNNLFIFYLYIFFKIIIRQPVSN